MFNDLFHMIVNTYRTPACITFALTPRKCSSFPNGELTNFMASNPKRAVNFLQPECGGGVISRMASPMENFVPAGRLFFT